MEPGAAVSPVHITVLLLSHGKGKDVRMSQNTWFDGSEFHMEV